MGKLLQRVLFLVISCTITLVAVNLTPIKSTVVEETVFETVQVVDIDNATINAITTVTDEIESTNLYSEDDLDILAHIVWGEAGSNWISDSTQQYVASVVLNRVNSDSWPDTIYDVVHQRGQYSCIGWCFSSSPTQRCYDNALYVLMNGSQLPENVVYQSSVAMGPVYCVQNGIVFSYG